MGMLVGCFLLSELKPNIMYSEIEESDGESSINNTGNNEKMKNLVLKNLNISIQPGGNVAICGRSGR
jgi:ABC-type multidrug transport system fused ATPase/permease subunit